MAAVRVRAVSPIWSLDRDLDYLVDDDLPITIGQRVLITLGKQKRPELAVVVDTLATSEFAVRHIDQVLNEPPMLSKTHIEFLGQVARRYCVSLGEILALAVPDFMARTAAALRSDDGAPGNEPQPFALPAMRDQDPEIVKPSNLGHRVAVLTAARSSLHDGLLLSDWARQAVVKASEAIARGGSVLVCTPEQSDIQHLKQAFTSLAPEIELVVQDNSETRSQRYARYRKLQSEGARVGLVTRSGLLWQVHNLQLLLLHDDLDDSLREPSSPYYQAWEIALLRADQGVAAEFLSPYRSASLQRLVSIGYLQSSGIESAVRGIEFSRPEELSEKSILPFMRKAAAAGTVLVLTTRKGSNSGVRCKSCGAARVCEACHGSIWVTPEGAIQCRICMLSPTGSCGECESTELSLGKLGSARIAADIGKALPGVRVIEIDANTSPDFSGKPNQVVVATAGSAPHLQGGYSGLVIFDASAWQANPHPTADLIAHRDWLSAIELLHPSAPIYIRNVASKLAQEFVLGRFIGAADRAVVEGKQAGLYPELKYFRIEADGHLSTEVAGIVNSCGGEVLKVTSSERFVLIGRIAVSKSLTLADALRPWVKTQKPSKANPKRRPVAIEFDYEAWR